MTARQGWKWQCDEEVTAGWPRKKARQDSARLRQTECQGKEREVTAVKGEDY